MARSATGIQSSGGVGKALGELYPNRNFKLFRAQLASEIAVAMTRNLSDLSYRDALQRAAKIDDMTLADFIASQSVIQADALIKRLEDTTK